MWRFAGVVALLAGCGRIGFPARGDASGDGPGDTTTVDTAVASGLLLYFPMENPATSGPTDASGNGHTATCVATTCPTLVTGKIGSAYHFDGVDDHLSIPYTATLDTSTGFTIAFWFKMDTIGNEVAFTAKEDAAGQSWSVELDTSAAEMFYTGPTPNDDYIYDFTPAAVNTWTHFTATWDGTTKRVYTNGTFQMSHAFSLFGSDTHEIMIGAQHRPGQYYYPLSGSLDDFRIYDRALAQAEITVISR